MQGAKPTTGVLTRGDRWVHLLASPKGSFTCVSCHDPHKKAEFAMKQECGTRHIAEQAGYAETRMAQVDVRCIDCHMPRAVKLAVKSSTYEADVRSHLFTINLNPEAEMFTGDAKLAQGYLTVEYACPSCRKDMDKEWALEEAKQVH